MQIVQQLSSVIKRRRNVRKILVAKTNADNLKSISAFVLPIKKLARMLASTKSPAWCARTVKQRSKMFNSHMITNARITRRVLQALGFRRAACMHALKATGQLFRSPAEEMSPTGIVCAFPIIIGFGAKFKGSEQ